MSSSRKIAEFPDVEAKLQKPTKQSAFERQKAEAEAKRLREAAETAAVYEDFVKSFDADTDNDGIQGKLNSDSRGRGSGLAPPRGGFGGGGGRRHFGAPGGGMAMKSSGPGTLGPTTPSLGKKRTYEGFSTNSRNNNNNNSRRDHPTSSAGRLGFDDSDDTPSKPLARAFDASDDEDERTTFGTSRSEDKAVARPTLRLVNLPPATSPAAIKALIPSNVTVEGVKIISPSAPGGASGTDRKALTAIVTLSQETAASEIDAAVSALQNKYLGFGHYLSLHRHLSSAAIAMASDSNIVGPGLGSQPFGAKPVSTHGSGGPPHAGGGRFAPPSSYGPPGATLNRNLLYVSVQPPTDIKQLRMIHKVVESVLEHGPEFEALLMTRPDVQREEKWAWLWDARSQGGIWYRWRLWEILTGGGQSAGKKGRYLPLFEGSHAWKVPDKQLVYEYTTAVDGFVSEPEYDSEFDDEDDDEPKIITEANKEQEEVFLNPIEKAKLVHLLSRLPTTLSRIRKGDIARITSFAITHANRGADEIVDLIVSNIEKPFAFSTANLGHKQDTLDVSINSRDASPLPGPAPMSDPKQPDSSSQDTSGAKLVALYVISDILSSSSTSGIRHAWRYRQLFDMALKSRHVFEGLGLMPERMNWGRLRAEKWKRSVGLVLSLWEGWCVFPNDSQELFVKSFENPPSAKKDIEKNTEGEEKAKGKWKTVEAVAVPEVTVDAPPPEDGDGSDGSYNEYTDDEEMDNELLATNHIDGESLLDLDIVGLAIEGEVDVAAERKAASTAGTGPTKRKRMTAADMFADSGSDDD